MNYQLLLGDCLDVLPTLADQSVHLVLADTPYGQTSCKWDSVIPLEPMWVQLKRVIKPRGAIVLFGSQPFTSRLVMSNLDWFQYSLVWEKDKASNFAVAQYRPLKYHEDILVFSCNTHLYNPQMWDAGFMTNKAGRNGGMSRNGRQDIYGRKSPLPAIDRLDTMRYPKSIIRTNTPKHNAIDKSIHPTQKPVVLLEYLVRTYTNEGEIVLDFTMGSGSTGVACLNTGRRFIGIEKEPSYYAIACKRMAEANMQPSLLAESVVE